MTLVKGGPCAQPLQDIRLDSEKSQASKHSPSSEVLTEVRYTAMTPLDLPFVEVEWVDATSTGGWNDLTFYQDFVPVKCRTAGYLSKKTETCIQVIQTVSEHSVTECMTIPVAAVTNIIVHREGGDTDGPEDEGRKEDRDPGRDPADEPEVE